MKRRTGRYLWAMMLMAVLCATRANAQVNRSEGAEVAVLCTLHQFHEEVPGYSYADLKLAIERLKPDVLVVELTPTDLAEKKPQKIKREYQNAVYPLLEQHKWKAVAMEPEGELSKKLIATIREGESSFDRDFPQKAETAQLYADTLFEYLRSRWHSAADVNSVWTDDLFAVKHAFLEKLYGPKEVEGWEGWNQHFLERIMETVKANPGKRIVVTVGAEHGYWLRGRLRREAGVKLVDTAEALGR